MVNLGERIRQCREAKKLSQESLAQLMGKAHRNAIGNWESGKNEPSLSDLRKLAEILETTPAWLLGDDTPTPVGEPPAGYVLMRASEVIDMQRQLINQQADELALSRKK